MGDVIADAMSNVMLDPMSDAISGRRTSDYKWTIIYTTFVSDSRELDKQLTVQGIQIELYSLAPRIVFCYP